MPPPESRHEQIAAALRARLASIDAATQPTKYWYTPSFVLRVDHFLMEYLQPKVNGQDVDVLYLIRPGDEFTREAYTGGGLRSEAEIFVLGAKQWRPNTRSPYSLQPPLRWTIQSRLARDVQVAIQEDMTLGMKVSNTEVRDKNFEIFLDDNVLWAPVELRLMVTYRHQKDEM